MKSIFKLLFIIAWFCNLVQSMEKIKAKLRGAPHKKKEIRIERLDSAPVQCRPPGALRDYTPAQALQDSERSNLKDDANLSFFHVIKNGNSEEVFNFLNDKNNKIDVNSQEANGDTALHHLVRNLPILNMHINQHDLAQDTKIRKLIKILLIYGANPDIANNKGETPKSLAKEKKKDDLFFEALLLCAQTDKQFRKKYSNKSKKRQVKDNDKTEIKTVKQSKIKKMLLIPAFAIVGIFLIYKLTNKNSKK